MENFQSIDEKNRYCLFQLWLKIVNFFTIFFFVLINVVIVGWIVIKTNDFKTFFRNFDVSHTINYLNNLPLNSNFFVKDFTGIIILVGLFVAYCYFFDYIKNKGLNFDEESENKGKMFSSFSYAFFISILLAILITAGYFQNWFGDITLDNSIQIMFILFYLVIILLATFIFYLIYPRKSTDTIKFYNLIFFLKDIRYRDDYRLNSVYIFFVTLELPIFGYFLKFNILSIFCLELLLLYLLWILGIYNSIPLVLSNIKLQSGKALSQVYILSNQQRTEKNFVSILTRQGDLFEINKSSILCICDKCLPDTISNSVTPDNLLRTKLNESTFYGSLSKINVLSLFILSEISLIIGDFGNVILKFIWYKELWLVTSILIIFVIVIILLLIIPLYFMFKK